MMLHQLIESSLCVDIHHALEGIETYCNAARLKFWYTAGQPLSQHQCIAGQDRLPACRRGNDWFAVTVELVVLTLMVLWAVLYSTNKDQHLYIHNTESRELNVYGLYTAAHKLYRGSH